MSLVDSMDTFSPEFDFVVDMDMIFNDDIHINHGNIGNFQYYADIQETWVQLHDENSLLNAIEETMASGTIDNPFNIWNKTLTNEPFDSIEIKSGLLDSDAIEIEPETEVYNSIEQEIEYEIVPYDDDAVYITNDFIIWQNLQVIRTTKY